MIDKIEFAKRLGDNIRIQREHKELSMEALAALANMGYSQLSRIENGQINTSIYNLYSIAEALNIHISILLI